MEIDVNKLCLGCLSEKPQAGGKCPFCGFDESSYTPAPQILPAGSILNGKYLLGKILGQGGFGITYMGWELNFELRVAIKEYYPLGFVTREGAATVHSCTGDKGAFFEQGKTRFLDEARRLAKFSSQPGIVSVRDFFQENGTAYIVMEYLEGETLAARLAALGGRMTMKDTLALLWPVMESLAQVHSAQIIHRDISPDNIIIGKDGTVCLLDFGAAREFSTGAQSQTVLLKHGYAPKEQYQTRGLQGPWTDIYALCATIYRCITGQVPPEVIDRTPKDPLQKPSALGVYLTAAQESALLKGLAVEQEERWRTLSELMTALSVKQPEPKPDPRPDPPPEPKPKPTPTPTPKPSLNPAPKPVIKLGVQPKPLLKVLGGCAAALVAVVFLWSSLFATPEESGDDKRSSSLGSVPAMGDIAGLTSSAASASSSSQGAGESAEAVLEKAVRESMGRPNGKITIGEAAQVKMLSICGEAGCEKAFGWDSLPDESGRIANLEDLRHFVGLKELCIVYNAVSDLAPLEGMTQLEDLWMINNLITDLTPLKGLTSLLDLNLAGNNISNLAPLQNLTGLEAVRVWNNQISNISALQRLTALTYLDFQNNQVSDLTPLQGMTQLQDLDFSGNQVRDLSPLEDLNELTFVDTLKQPYHGLVPSETRGNGAWKAITL